MMQETQQETVAVLSRDVPVRLSAAEDRSRVRRKALIDKAVGITITGGGIAIILSVAAILFVIVAETLPLWRSPTAEPKNTVTLGHSLSPSAGRPMAIGVEEYQTIAYILWDTGTVDFLSVSENRVIERYDIQALRGQRVTAAYRDGLHHTVAIATANGQLIPLTITFSTTLNDGKRTITPKVTEEKPLQIDPQGRALVAVVYREGDGKTAAAAVVAGSRSVLFFAQKEQTSTLFGPAGVKEYHAELSPVPDSDISALALDKYQTYLLVGTAGGEILQWDVSDPEAPTFQHRFLASQQPGIGVTALGWVLGDRSLIVGDTAGNVSVWFQVRDPQDPTSSPYRRVHVLRAHDAAVTAVAPSPRDRGFLSADRNGTIFLHHATSTQTLLELPAGTGPISLLTMAPKADGIYAVAADVQLRHWFLSNPHPEITLRALFGKVWYEGYDHPDYTWQSSSGSDEFEPKFSLTPLAYGTLKGTFYALLLAVPLSVCGAIYTSQFLHPRFRNFIKPTVEVMAALPSVVLGFFAGLWLAPRVEQIVPGIFLMFFALPAATFAASLLWRLVPASFRSRLRPGAELFALAPLLVLTAYVCLRLNDPIEAAFFGGHFPQWLFDTTGVRYDPRNSLVVGFAMGFAVVPIIYTICEDAFSNVPQHLISGSFALGATRWQTALRVVLPTASPGVFSAIMIGFGRAVGETMIVLMATGNTPVMDFSPFSGFRALSANIAVEIPEAPHGGTLYRVLFLAALLLFILTFLVNTAAEVVRQRLRERYSRI